MNLGWYDIDDDDECEIAQIIACPLIQNELDNYTVMWNECKRIRNQKNNVLPNDKPDMIFNFPNLYGLDDFNCKIPLDLLESAKQQIIETANEYPQLQTPQHDSNLIKFTEYFARAYLQNERLTLTNFTQVIQFVVRQYRRF